ncbi:MAG TPA: PilZ domain-containing protein [Terriglobales bacterium]|nr:PilZ domain-containing protein [Terriglobales bacterium]
MVRELSGTIQSNVVYHDSPQVPTFVTSTSVARNYLHRTCSASTLLVLLSTCDLDSVEARTRTGHAVENRRFRRYRLNASVKFCWDPVNGGGGEGEGLTRDMSVSGAYIVTNSRIPLGTLLSMIVTLPAIQPAARSPQLSIKARIVRADACGFAVTGDMGFRLEYPERQRQGSAAQEGRSEKENAVVFFPGLQTRAS